MFSNIISSFIPKTDEILPSRRSSSKRRINGTRGSTTTNFCGSFPNDLGVGTTVISTLTAIRSTNPSVSETSPTVGIDRWGGIGSMIFTDRLSSASISNKITNCSITTRTIRRRSFKIPNTFFGNSLSNRSQLVIIGLRSNGPKGTFSINAV